MNDHHAPLYVEAHDLARWLLERLEGWHTERGSTLLRPLSDTTCDLVTSVSLALTFPQGRRDYLLRADESVVRLRMLLRLACDLALLSPGGLRHAQGQLRTIGRMLGGWQRQLRQSERNAATSFENQGTGSPATPA